MINNWNKWYPGTSEKNEPIFFAKTRFYCTLSNWSFVHKTRWKRVILHISRRYMREVARISTTNLALKGTSKIPFF